MQIRDGKNSNQGSGDGKNSDPGWKKFRCRMEKIRIQAGKNLDPGWKKFEYEIWDKHPGSVTLEISPPTLLGLVPPNN
jgi:hypothetical protein